MLPSDERIAFAERVYALKSRHLQDMVDKRQLTLRQGGCQPTTYPAAAEIGTSSTTPGVMQLLQDMVNDGVEVGIIAETNSSPELRAVEAVLALLGDELAAAVRVFPTAATPSESDSDDWEDVEGVGMGTTLEHAVQQAQAKVWGLLIADMMCVYTSSFHSRSFVSVQCAVVQPFVVQSC